MLDDKDRNVLRQCWDRSKGKAWEPQGGTNIPRIKRFVEAGYVRIIDGRCGFELLRDAMVEWTEAGREAMKAQDARDVWRNVTPLEVGD